MSRTWNHKKDNWYGCKKGLREGCRNKHRAREKAVLDKINKDPDVAEELIIDRYQDCDNWWNYD